MRLGSDSKAIRDTDPLGIVGSPRWVVLSDVAGKVLFRILLSAPVDQRRALAVACQIIAREGYEISSIVPERQYAWLRRVRVEPVTPDRPAHLAVSLSAVPP